LDAYILANLIRNITLIDEIIEEEEYQNGREMFKRFIDDLLDDSDKAIIDIHNDGLVAKDKNRKVVKYFLDITIMFFADLFRFQQVSIPWYTDRVQQMSKSSYNDRHILNILLSTRDLLISNANIGLLMDQMFYQIQEVVNGK
jgi:hypothetical protein